MRVKCGLIWLENETVNCDFTFDIGSGSLGRTYPKISDANFKGALSKCECVVEILFFSCKHLCAVKFGIRNEINFITMMHSMVKLV